MISLEARGVLENRFKHTFRRRKPWNVDWSLHEVPEDEPCRVYEYATEVD
jgi:hypothetical protein